MKGGQVVCFALRVCMTILLMWWMVWAIQGVAAVIAMTRSGDPMPQDVVPTRTTGMQPDAEHTNWIVIEAVP